MEKSNLPELSKPEKELMVEEITLGAGNTLPCLNCGKMIDLDGDIHLCNAEKGSWLKQQDRAEIIFSDGKKFDLKTKKN